MGTKNNPGEYDCYDKAEPDEPMFVLLARDPSAPTLVRQWVETQYLQGKVGEKCTEALICAEEMETWRKANR